MPLLIQIDEYGPPSVLKVVERAAPQPGPREVVVRMVVAGVNRSDCFTRAGTWLQAGGFPHVPGLEVAGVVEAVGGQVRDLRVGARVVTMMQKLGGVHGSRDGGYQELVTVPVETLARIPDALTTEQAGALGLPAVTALLGLRSLEIQPGMRVLVQGGSSAVGSIALQIIRSAGGLPLASSTSASKHSYIRQCGAEEVIDTTDPHWMEQVEPVDRVLELVGQATFDGSVRVLKPGGRLSFVGGVTGGEVRFDAWNLTRPVQITGYSSETLHHAELQGAMNSLALLVANLGLKVHGLNCYALPRAADAHAAIEAGELHGRTVLVPTEDDVVS